MFPELFHIGSFPINTYGVFLALAFLTAILISVKLAARDGLPREKIYDLCLWMLLASLIGSKLLMLFTNFFGRLGCFAAGCCWGKPTTLPWGVKFTELGHEITGVPTDVHLHPTQLYESFSMLIGFFFLLWLHRNRRFSGQVILTYALLYSVVRFTIEFVRDDPRGDILGLTTLTGLSTSQMISIIVAVVSLIVMIIRWRKAGAIAQSKKVSGQLSVVS